MIGEVKKFIRDDGIIKVSRNIRELSLKISDIETKFFNKTGENINIEEMSKILEVSKEEIIEAKRIINNVKSLNNEIENEDGNNVNSIDRLFIDNEEQSKIVDRIMLIDSVDALNKRDKNIIDLRYFKEKTQVQVAKILGISQVQVSRIERKILTKLKESLA